MLQEQEKTFKLLEKYQLPFTVSKLAKNKDEAKKFAKELGFPLVMKIDSPDAIHKSDMGGVILDIKDENQAKDAYEKILSNLYAFKKDAKLNGVLIQRQLKGHQMIAGMTKDAQFGQVIIFGLGGIYVEVFKDVSKRIAPINKEDALEMINEIKSKKLLEGTRGQKPVDKEKLADILVKLSNLSMTEKNISEIDFNPIICDESGSYIVDARVILND